MYKMEKGKSIIVWKKLGKAFYDPAKVKPLVSKGILVKKYRKNDSAPFRSAEVIAKLRIPSRARRWIQTCGWSLDGKKCRAEWAYVEELYFVLRYDYFLDSTKVVKIRDKNFSAWSKHNYHFKYQAGQKVVPDFFDSNPYVCSGGIHFFLDRKDAIDYP